MINSIIILVGFLFFMTLAAACTAASYLILYGILAWTISSFDVLERFPWMPLAVTVLVFLVALITTIRRQIPDLTNLSWDSGTREETPSRISISRKGGRFWNMNPLGPQSFGSIAAIGAGFLCLGPSIAMAAVISTLEELRSNRQQTRGGKE